jgi:hypothetical protein
MESSLMMIAHAIVIGVVLYLIMIYGLKQQQTVAQDRTIVLSAIILIYMIVFGHGLPTKINQSFKF